MERLKKHAHSGLNSNGLRTWGMLFVAIGILSQGLLQNRILGIGTLTGQQLLEAMSASQQTMILATAALLMQAAGTCAVPLFAFLLVEGFLHTKNYLKYLVRVAGVALLSEIPYNLAMSSKLLDLSSRNPAFGLALSLILLYFFRRYGEKSAQNTMIKLIVLIAAVLWSMMLNIQNGLMLVLTVSVLWALREKPQMRILIGAVTSVAFTVLSPYYLASPMAYLSIHLYNGEPGSENRWVNYLAYPVILLIIALTGIVFF